MSEADIIVEEVRQACAKPVTVIGMSDNGCVSLTARAVNCVQRAQVLIGGQRHLAFFPQFEGLSIPIKGKLTALIQKIDELSQENNVVVLASGDPLFFGIGGLLTTKLGFDRVEVLAHPGSVQLAFSKIGVNWDDAKAISLHGRPMKGLITAIQNYSKAAVLTDQVNTPQRVAAYMLEYGEGNWTGYVCENLDGVDERVRSMPLMELSCLDDVSALNVLILIRDDKSWRPPPVIGFLHEDDFDKRMPKKGLITKREVRLLSIGFMGLRPDSIVWDVGAASGSVSIEAAKLCPRGFVYAVEVSAECVGIGRDNCIRHRVDNVEVIEGRAPDALKGLPTPDAVFVGGSKGGMRNILDYTFEQLNEGGCLVVNAITLENVQEAYQYFKDKALTPTITQLNVSRGVPLAHYHRYEALNPIHIFAVRKVK